MNVNDSSGLFLSQKISSKYKVPVSVVVNKFGESYFYNFTYSVHNWPYAKKNVICVCTQILSKANTIKITAKK